MNWQYSPFFVLFLGLFLLTAAQGCGRADERPAPPDVSQLPVDLTVRRFEQDLFALDTARMQEALAELEVRYPDFADLLLRRVLAVRKDGVAPEVEAEFMRGFIYFPPLRQLYDTVQQVYPELGQLEAELEQALRYFRYYFPDQPVPRSLTTFVSEYSIAGFVYGENDLAVGLDMFLGAGYPYMQYNVGNPNFSAYLTRTYNRDHLVAKILQPLVDDLLGPPPGERLLDMMVHNGKKLYILDHLLPTTSDTVKMEVTPAQWAWLTDNEQEMWAYFLQENLLYNSRWQDIRKLVEPSPNSPGMPPEAPGRTANWMGWQIVKAYMQRHPNATFTDLLAQRDAQQLMEAARYKPRRN